MAIKKQEFYEGAALHLLVRAGGIRGIRYEAPFFVLNEHLLVHFKYSTKGRSPWAFTFTHDEQELMQGKCFQIKTVIALICGSDGVAAVTYQDYLKIALPRKVAVHIACYRQHGEHYEINGPDGQLDGKVSPSSWRRILECEGIG
jgi:hypothetical protein